MHFPKQETAPFICPKPADRLKHRNTLIALAASAVLLVGVAGWLALQIYAVDVIDQGVNGILIRSRSDRGAQK